MGGHSLRVTVLVARIHKELNVKVPLAQVFDNPNIRELAEFIKGQGEDRHASVESLEKREYYELSLARKRMYILQQMDPDSTAYHRPRFIPPDEIEELLPHITVEIGVGVETARDDIRELILNKGVTTEELVEVGKKFRGRKTQGSIYPLEIEHEKKRYR